MFEMKSFKGNNRITFQEGEILYNMVLRRKPSSILEIGTYSAYATIFLAKALKELDERNVIYSVGNPTDLSPPAEANMTSNDVRNAHIIRVPNILEKIKEYIPEVQLIFVDDCHNETDIVWQSIKELAEPGTVVIFHDALCPETEDMKVQSVITEIQEQQEVLLIETQDDVGNLNGFAMIEVGEVVQEVKPEDQVIVEEVVEEKGIEPASEDVEVEIKAVPKEEKKEEEKPEKKEKAKPKRKRAPRKKKVVEEKSTDEQKEEK